MSYRLFTAIRPPAAVRAILTAIMGGVEGARWQSDDQLHLTLRFIGEVDRTVAEDVAAALNRVRQSPFEVTIAGLGSFDTRGRIDTLWANVQPCLALDALHAKIDRAIVTCGLEPERRAYKPHITLARFGWRGGDPAPFIAARGGLALPPWPVSDFALFESTLGREDALYTEVARYALRA